jgi:plasmid stabilization system protein ParE
LRVNWTDKAKNDLNDIFIYYSEIASKNVAKSITKNIVSRSLDLKSNPYLGMIEEYLLHRTKNYRSIIDGNYKIIYFVENDSIYIATVFDCRQNPIKLSNIN